MLPTQVQELGRFQRSEYRHFNVVPPDLLVC